MSFNNLDPDKMEIEYKRLLQIILKYSELDVVKYMDAMEKLKKLESMAMDAGFLAIHCVVFVDRRHGEALTNAMDNVLRRFGR